MVLKSQPSVCPPLLFLLPVLSLTLSGFFQVCEYDTTLTLKISGPQALYSLNIGTQSLLRRRDPRKRQLGQRSLESLQATGRSEGGFRSWKVCALGLWPPYLMERHVADEGLEWRPLKVYGMRQGCSMHGLKNGAVLSTQVG